MLSLIKAACFSDVGFYLISSLCKIELVRGQIMASCPPPRERKSMKKNMAEEEKGGGKEENINSRRKKVMKEERTFEVMG